MICLTEVLKIEITKITVFILVFLVLGLFQLNVFISEKQRWTGPPGDREKSRWVGPVWAWQVVQFLQRPREDEDLECVLFLKNQHFQLLDQIFVIILTGVYSK